MTFGFIIRNLFELPRGVTVLACEEVESTSITIDGRVGRLAHGGEVRQEICLSGERGMMHQASSTPLRAFETSDKVRLTVEEAQSGAWTLTIALPDSPRTDI